MADDAHATTTPERSPAFAQHGVSRVLVVDDDPGLSRLVSAILRSAGYHVTTAVNGSDALDRAEAESFDAIVLDLLMPVLDGRGFYRELRARGDGTPVLIASAYGARDAKNELGAEGYISKPFEPEGLLHSVAGIMTNGDHQAANSRRPAR